MGWWTRGTGLATRRADGGRVVHRTRVRPAVATGGDSWPGPRQWPLDNSPPVGALVFPGSDTRRARQAYG